MIVHYHHLLLRLHSQGSVIVVTWINSWVICETVFKLKKITQFNQMESFTFGHDKFKQQVLSSLTIIDLYSFTIACFRFCSFFF